MKASQQTRNFPVCLRIICLRHVTTTFCVFSNRVLLSSDSGYPRVMTISSTDSRASRNSLTNMSKNSKPDCYFCLKANGCGRFNAIGSHNLIGDDTIRKYNLIEVGMALLEDCVIVGADLELSYAQDTT